MIDSNRSGPNIMIVVPCCPADLARPPRELDLHFRGATDEVNVYALA
jgi:hypothetical protein